MAAFDAQIKHWPTIAAFAAYLQGVPRPPWVTGLTNHNTYRPNEFTWQGLASMHSMTQAYIDKGWSAGPHLYLCAAAPNAADTGIWAMTPLGHVGVHAGACNDDHLGIEWVGDFEARQPTAEQYTLGITINLLILKHWGLPPGSVNVHRDCMPGRTCPGKHLTSEQIRASLRAPAPPDPFQAWGPIGTPTGVATGFAVPRAWLVNKKLGACVVPETYSASGKYSVTEFENGLIWYFKARNSTKVELF
jgi:N-acetylmuramoyl-L-alanine amidase-like protein